MRDWIYVYINTFSCFYNCSREVLKQKKYTIMYSVYREFSKITSKCITRHMSSVFKPNELK